MSHAGADRSPAERVVFGVTHRRQECLDLATGSHPGRLAVTAGGEHDPDEAVLLVVGAGSGVTVAGDGRQFVPEPSVTIRAEDLLDGQVDSSLHLERDCARCRATDYPTFGTGVGDGRLDSRKVVAVQSQDRKVALNIDRGHFNGLTGGACYGSLDTPGTNDQMGDRDHEAALQDHTGAKAPRRELAPCRLEANCAGLRVEGLRPGSITGLSDPAGGNERSPNEDSEQSAHVCVEWMSMSPCRRTSQSVSSMVPGNLPRSIHEAERGSLSHRDQDPDVTSVAEELLEDLAKVEVEKPIEVPRGVLGVLYRIRVGIEAVSVWTGRLARALVWLVFILGLFAVVTRYIARFIERDIIIGELFDLQWMVFGAMTLLGLNYGVLEGVNPRIDFWWANFSAKRKAWIDLIFHTFFLLPFLIMSISILWGYSLSAMGRSFDGSWSTWKVWEIWEQSTDAGGLARGPIKLVMLIGFILMATQIIAEIIKQILVLKDREDLAGIKEQHVPLRVE